MRLGALEYIVVGFDHPDFKGAIADEIGRVIDAGIVRLVDAVVVRKDAAGNVAIVEVDNKDDPHFAAFEPLIRDAIALFTPEDRGAVRGGHADRHGGPGPALRASLDGADQGRHGGCRWRAPQPGHDRPRDGRGAEQGARGGACGRRIGRLNRTPGRRPAEAQHRGSHRCSRVEPCVAVPSSVPPSWVAPPITRASDVPRARPTRPPRMPRSPRCSSRRMSRPRPMRRPQPRGARSRRPARTARPAAPVRGALRRGVRRGEGEAAGLMVSAGRAGWTSYRTPAGRRRSAGSQRST